MPWVRVRRRGSRRSAFAYLRRIPGSVKRDMERYGVSGDRLQPLSALAPRLAESGQRILDDLASRDGIEPPILKVKDHTIYYDHHVTLAAYNPNSRVITVDTGFAVFSWAHGLNLHTHDLLHEYRHHWQYQTPKGAVLVNKARDQFGQPWHEQDIEKDADGFARRTSKEHRWQL